MQDRAVWNKIAMNNNGSPLHSWEWGKAKELSGNEVAWFFVDNDRLKIAVPMIIKKIGFLRSAWLPDGLPFSGDVLELKKELVSFLKEKKVIFMATRFMADMCNEKELGRILLKIRRRDNIRTFLLKFGDRSENEVFQRFHATTRKHIHRAQREGYVNVDLEAADYEAFWSGYERFSAAKGFPLPFNRQMFFSLLSLVDQPGDQPGLKFIAKKTLKSGQPQGFMLALGFGRRALELIRLDNDAFKMTDFGPKLLSWGVISQALRDGVKYYDFGRLDIKKQPGLLQFKGSFGGEISSLSDLMLRGCV